MWNSKLPKSAVFLTVLVLASTVEVRAQGEWSSGFEVVNQYVWRGVLYDDGVNFQPYLMYSRNGFEAGVASSTSFTNDFNEIYFWAAYTLTLNSLDLTLNVADYYYEQGMGNFLNFKGVQSGEATGAHFVESSLELSGENTPFSLLFSGIIWNDPDHSMYAELGYHKTLGNETEATFNLGVALNESRDWYFNRKSGLINVSFGLSRSIRVTDNFSIPLSSQAILNPYSESFYVVLAVGL